MPIKQLTDTEKDSLIAALKAAIVEKDELINHLIRDVVYYAGRISKNYELLKEYIEILEGKRG